MSLGTQIRQLIFEKQAFARIGAAAGQLGRVGATLGRNGATISRNGVTLGRRLQPQSTIGRFMQRAGNLAGRAALPATIALPGAATIGYGVHSMLNMPAPGTPQPGGATSTPTLNSPQNTPALRPSAGTAGQQLTYEDGTLQQGVPTPTRLQQESARLPYQDPHAIAPRAGYASVPVMNTTKAASYNFYNSGFTLR